MLTLLSTLLWLVFLYAAHLAYPTLMHSAFLGIFVVTGMSAVMAALIITSVLPSYTRSSRSVGEAT
jgi:hypothetical protein